MEQYLKIYAGISFSLFCLLVMAITLIIRDRRLKRERLLKIEIAKAAKVK